MILNLPPALRAQIDQQYAEFSEAVDGLVKSCDLMESTEPVDRANLIATAIYTGLAGDTELRLRKAVHIAAVAIERLSRRSS